MLGGSTSSNSVAGSTATFTFSGSYVAWVTEKDPSHGQTVVSIDGVATPSIDNYNAASKTRRVMFVRTLPPGTHTIALKVLATKNPAATGTRTDVDTFIVFGEHGESPGPTATAPVASIVNHSTLTTTTVPVTLSVVGDGGCGRQRGQGLRAAAVDRSRHDMDADHAPDGADDQYRAEYRAEPHDVVPVPGACDRWSRPRRRVRGERAVHRLRGAGIGSEYRLRGRMADCGAGECVRRIDELEQRRRQYRHVYLHRQLRGVGDREGSVARPDDRVDRRGRHAE